MEKDFTDDTILARWINGELSEEELSGLSEKTDLPALEQVLERMEGLQFPPFDEQERWKALADKMENVEKQPEQSKVLLGRKSWWLGIAAGLALILGLCFYLFYPSEQMLIAQAGAQQSFTLPCGSMITLNAGSRASYDPEGWGEKRRIQLNGEGYFEVEKGNPFWVYTSQAKVEVLGTKFNVRARDKQVVVQCFEGKVSVSLPQTTQGVILKENDLIKIINNRLTAIQKHTDASPLWLSGKIKFESQSLSEVFAELERKYTIEIIDQGSAADRQYSGTVPATDLDHALKLICEAMNLRYIIVDDQRVEILSK
ncbi:MAG: FecR domain-containing protein [Bacteroidota bacterium]